MHNDIVTMLLNEPDVVASLNASTNYTEFASHWDNYELTPTLSMEPSQSMYEQLHKAYTHYTLPADYHTSWWSKVTPSHSPSPTSAIPTSTTPAHSVSFHAGSILDAFTASMLYQIGINLNPANFKKFTSLPLHQAVNVGWKLYNKSKGAAQ